MDWWGEAPAELNAFAKGKIFKSRIRMVRPKTAPSRGLALGHGSASAYVQSSSAAYRVTINRSAKSYWLFGSLAPPI